MESLAQSSCRAVSIYSSFTLFKASGEAQERLINQIISLFTSQSKKFQKTNQSYYFNFITYLNFFEPFLLISYKIIIQKFVINERFKISLVDQVQVIKNVNREAYAYHFLLRAQINFSNKRNETMFTRLVRHIQFLL